MGLAWASGLKSELFSSSPFWPFCLKEQNEADDFWFAYVRPYMLDLGL